MLTDEEGDRSTYYVRDGKVGRDLRPDGALLVPCDPADYVGTWEPYIHEVTEEQIEKLAIQMCLASFYLTFGDSWPTGVNDDSKAFWRKRATDVLPALGCREVLR